MKSNNTHFYRLIFSQFRRFFSLAALVSVLILFPIVTHGAEVTLAWDANTEPDLAGYNIYYGTASGDYSDPPIDVGDVTEVTLTGFDDGGTYYFAATAYDEDENESAYSDELVHTFSSGKPGNTVEAEDMPIKTTGGPISGGWNIWGNGYIAEDMDFAAGGTFSFEVMARGDYAGGAWPIMEIRIDQTPVGTVTVDSSSWAAYRIQASITPGTHELAIAFINDYYNSPDDRDLYVDKVTITVAGGNLPPEASIIAGGINGIVPYLVNFDGSGSHDPDGEINSYDWVFGDGTIDSGDTVSHTFSDPGVYTVTLTVTDDQGATGSDTIQITASSGPSGEVEITASAGANGGISPSGNVTVSHGSNQTFTISADTNYHVQDVLVNGVSVGAVTSYTFTNVTKNHTIQASFAINTHTITATGGANGSISPSGSVTVNHGSNRTFTISADANYHVQDVLVDGTSVGAVTSYTFTNVTKNHTIQASFAINTHTITATGGANGSISPSGSVTVNHGSNRTFTVSADANYHVQDVLVDGTSVGAVTSYTFTNVTQNHTIQASFAINTHTITATGGANGSISPSGNVTVNHGSNQTFTISAGTNYHIQDIMVNGISVGAVASYKFTNVTQDCTIQASFAIDNQPPVADAGADQSVGFGDRVQLDGSGSSDVDMSSLTFKWSFTSKPAGSSAALSDASAVNPTFDVVDVGGTYIVQLIVNDGTVDSAPDTVTISTKNSAPVSDAGADQSVRINDRVQLDGSGSSDVDGDSLTFTWSFVSKPDGSDTALSDTKAVKSVFDVDVAGSYTVQLIVNDGTVNSAPDTVTISTENSAPVADAGADQGVYVKDTVHLDGSNSSDADGDSLIYNWSIISQPSGSNATLSNPEALKPTVLPNIQAVKPTFDVDVAGTYTVQLIVNDGTVNSAPDTITISTENSVPVSAAGADQSVQINDTVQLDGSGSSDVDGDTLTFKWSLVSKPGGSNATLSGTKAVKPVFDVDVAGNYTVQLIVNDGTVNSAPDTVTISTENSAPVANAGADQAVQVNDTVQLDGSGSSDVDGDTLTFNWSLVSKPGNSSAVLSDTKALKPTVDVDIAGTYTLQLIVNDGTVNSAPDTVTISTENSAPVSHAGADQAVLVNDTVQLDGSASSDADGDTLTFKWSFVSKPGDSTATLSNTTVVKPTVDVDITGTYTLQLIVNDGTVNSAPDTVTISTENSAPVSHAGADQAVPVNDTVQLDGSASSDADGDTLTFKWSFISKPGGSTAVVSSKTTAKPTFKVDDAGTYTVQLIVNDGTDNSTPDTVTIMTENSAPVSDAGEDQTVEEGNAVALDGFNSTDPNDNITSYSWKQTGGAIEVNLTNPDEAEATFIAPGVETEPEMLTFELTVTDAEGLQDIDTCSVQVTKAVSQDSDGDGVPDDQDAFPNDPDEYLDTDGDGEGNNADTDDDNDSMPDTWELTYGLDPLKDDAADDSDGDGVSNINEYNLGTEPNNNEGNFEPYPPSLIAPDDHETVSLTPLLETDEFYDPNINDVHGQTQWEIMRAEGEFIVYDVTTSSSLTAVTVPKMILEYDTEYIWRVKFIDNHGAASDWSEAVKFTTEFSEEDSDGNGILDHQEVDDTLDLDNDGVADREQSDIKCIVADSGKAQIGISIRDAENVDSIMSLEIEEIDDASLLPKSKGKPSFIEFGLLHFKLLLNAPGEETTVTIHLSRAPFDKGKGYKKVKMHKYDPVNTEWLDYSEYAEFSSDRKKVYLTLKDGGFGDADGLENGIIVDPLAFGSESNSNSGSDSSVKDAADSLIPDVGCFISATTTSRPSDRQLLSLWREIRGSELSIVFILMVFGFVAKEISLRIKQKRVDGTKSLMR